MEFSSADIERFIDAMEADEHLRARVERAILSDRMYELPDRLADLAKQIEKLTKVVTKRLDNIESDVETLKSDVGTLKSDVGTLKGSDYERTCREFAPAILSRVNGGLRRLRSVQREALADLLDDAADKGMISQKQRDDVLASDLIVQAKSKVNGEEVYLAVEASVTLGSYDVTRAKERADTLSAALEKRALGVVVTAHPPVVDTSNVEVVLYQYPSSAG